MVENVNEITEIIDTEKQLEVYDTKIEFLFHEYFENRNIDISGTNFKTVPSSTFFSALNYVSDILFKIRKTDKRYNNKGTRIDLKNIDLLEEITDIYINKLIKPYNLIPRIEDYTNFLCINLDTFYDWNNKEFDRNGLSIRYFDLTEKVRRLSRNQTFRKLSDDKVGTIAIANYDDEVGMHYAENKSKLTTQGTLKALGGSELPKLSLDSDF